jgi:hypothetical protein
LLLTLLLLSALFRPYAGIVHDARLYAVQAMDHVAPGLHQEDLYLKYGSQDQYSLFSPVSQPLARWLGVPAAFFLLYLLGNACFLVACQRFVPSLVHQRLAALGALIYVAVNPLPFGGFETFLVNENFLTPRIWSVALVVLGLERLLRDRMAVSLACIVASMLLHPIMGFSGLCIWICWHLLRLAGPQAVGLMVMAGASVLAVVLLVEPLGTAIFGQMDQRWLTFSTGGNPYCRPTDWRASDWFAIATAFAIVASGRALLSMHANAKRLLSAVLLVAAVGLAVGTIAPLLSYKLLLQGQAYRALWPLQLIQIPVMFALVGSLLRKRLSTVGQRATLVVVLGFIVVVGGQWQLVAALLLLGAVYCWRSSINEIDASRVRMFRRCAQLAVCATVVLAVVIVANAYPVLQSWYTPLASLAAIPQAIGPILVWAMAAGVLLLLQRLSRSRAVYCGVAVCGWLGIQTLFFLVPTSSLYAKLGVEQARDVTFVEKCLNNSHARTGRTPSLYWPLGPLDDIWLRLRCNSFFSVPQVAGSMFNRGTAMEGIRRARLTRQFELAARQRWIHLCSDEQLRSIRHIFGSLEADPPTIDELLRVCADEHVDLVILPLRFDGWYADTNGHLYVYDARQIRQQGAACPSANQRE